VICGGQGTGTSFPPNVSLLLCHDYSIHAWYSSSSKSLTRRTKRRSLGTFQKAMVSLKSGSEKYSLVLAFKGLILTTLKLKRYQHTDIYIYIYTYLSIYLFVSFALIPF
jgi:hypothetical protein